MNVYMVERSLPGIAMPDLAAAQQRAIETAQAVSRAGTPVEYLRSTFVPGDGRCLCLFAADDAKAVEDVNRQAQIPFDRIVPAMDLPA